MRKEIAQNLFKEGYACSQAIALAFKDLVDIDEDTLSKLTLPLGGGLGRLRLTCGVVSGMAIVIGLVFANAENTSENKKNVYDIVQLLSNEFKEQTGSLICKEILTKASLQVETGGAPENRTTEYYSKRPCGEVVGIGCEILENYLIKQGIIK